MLLLHLFPREHRDHEALCLEERLSGMGFTIHDKGFPVRPDISSSLQVYPPLDDTLMASLGSAVRSDFEAGVRFSRNQVREDPGNPEGWVSIAESQILLHIFGYEPREKTLPGAREAFRRASQIDPERSRVLALEGKLNLLDWKWEDAGIAFRRAIDRDPENLDARHWYSLFHVAMGNLDAAFEQSDSIMALDRAGNYRIGRGSLLYFARRNEELKALMKEVIRSDSSVAWGYDWLGMAYIELGEYENSVNTYYKAFELSDGTVEVGGGLGHALGLAGEHEKARQLAGFYERQAKITYVPPVQRAFIHIGLGDHDRALELLREAYEQNSWFLIFIRAEPWYDPVSGDNRFRKLVRDMGFPHSGPVNNEGVKR